MIMIINENTNSQANKRFCKFLKRQTYNIKKNKIYKSSRTKTILLIKGTKL